MGKTYTAQNVMRIENVKVESDLNNQVTGIIVDVEVNYGEFGRRETLDIFPELNPGQQTSFQQFYTRMIEAANDVFVGE